TAFPLRRTIERLIASGRAQGLFRDGLDPIQLYVTIAALSRFHRGAGYALSVTLDTDMSKAAWRQARLKHAEDMLAAYLTTEPRAV
ncbi:MAG: TetR family transcriptional regulator, partial [Caulobacter sp.]|nr:TetR family transcriptional regulator [Caulobacter sp.]